MILAINIGNTHITVGCIENQSISKRFLLSTDVRKTGDEYEILLYQALHYHGIRPDDLSGAILSSVVPTLTDALTGALRHLTGKKPLTVGSGIKTGLNIRIDDPAQLGSDLVVLAVGALAVRPAPLAIVDMGTATTITVIDRENRLIGTVIAPGISLSLSALSDGASLLPEVRAGVPKNCIGTNTVDSMQAGAIYGGAAMLEGLLARAETQLSYPLPAIATGELARTIVPLCNREITIDEDLLLRGLATLYEKNKKQ